MALLAAELENRGMGLELPSEEGDKAKEAPCVCLHLV